MAEPLVKAPDQWASYLTWRGELAAALDPNLYTVDWLDTQIWSGAFALFSSEKSCILASVKRYPTGLLELHGQIAVGELNDILSSTIPSAENWARSIGCSRAVIESRKGWSKVMRDFGYEDHQVHIRKAL